MMLRNRLLIYVLCFFMTAFAAACAPAALETAESQSADAAAASETAHEEEDDHSAEDAAEHEHEEGDHSEEAAAGHEHEGEGEHRELGAHEHGAAALMIAWSGNEMAIDLQTPAYNVLGFEYAPTSDEEKAALAESVAALEAGTLLQFSPDAECTLVSASVQTGFSEEAHNEEGHSEEGHDEEGHDEEAHSAETHSDIDVSYNLTCQQPENIASLDASALFAQFPNFEEIEVQWVSDTQQSAAHLTPDNPVLSFE
ncbi:MAG: DUF2796 domain-containing protein [Caldilineaceae bacterium]